MMKLLWSGYQIKEKYQYGCHLGIVVSKFDVRILGTDVHRFVPNKMFLCQILWLGRCTQTLMIMTTTAPMMTSMIALYKVFGIHAK